MILTAVPPEALPEPAPMQMASAGTTTAQPAGSVTLTAQATLTTPVGNATVSYSGTTLVVDGQSYPRGTPPTHRGYAQGRVLVSPVSGRPTSEIEQLIARLGLRIDRALGGTPPIGYLVTVPEGYELQWQAALMRQPAVLSVDLDGRMTTQPVMPSMGPGVVR
jgi:hypothetical protein